MSIDPKAPPNFIVLTKSEVAQSQLEAAIQVWFAYGDPVSILTLAQAANDCYTALGGHVGNKSTFREWLSAQRPGLQARIRYVINWVKHGKKDLKKRPALMPLIGEILIVDSIECHENIFGKKTRLMGLFVGRFAAENPSATTALMAPIINQALKVDYVANRDRPDFLQRALNQF